MANQQIEIYTNAYLSQFADVVKPVTTKNEWPVMAEGEEKVLINETRRVGESHNTMVYATTKGRIFEVEPIGNGFNTMFHIFENEADWRNFRRPMSLAQYWGW